MSADPHHRTVTPFPPPQVVGGGVVIPQEHNQSPKPPTTNRGAQVTHRDINFGIHWLTGTTYLPEVEVLELLSNLLDGADYITHNFGVNRYKKTYETVNGIKVLVDPANPETMPPVCVIVTGQGCERLGLKSIQTLASILKPTRIDFAFDGVPFTPQELFNHYKKNNVRTRVRRFDYHPPNGKKARHWSYHQNGSGNTFYLGSQQSTQHLCCYDERGFTRMELRFKGERAEKAYEALTGDSNQLKLTALGWLREHVDFVDNSSSDNVSRQTLLPE